MAKDKKPTKAKKVISIIVDIILVIYLVFAVSLCVVAISSSRNGGTPSVFGFSLFTIETDSMETGEKDSLNVGDLIISKKITDFEKEIKVGDIITFKATTTSDDGTTVNYNNTHRIVRIENEGDTASDGTTVERLRFITQGDNERLNGVPDKDPVYPENVLAKYTGKKICGGGTVIKFLQSRTGIMICFVIPLAAFFLYALIRFIRNIVEMKYKDKPQTAELSEEEKARIAREYLASQGAVQQNGGAEPEPAPKAEEAPTAEEAPEAETAAETGEAPQADAEKEE